MTATAAKKYGVLDTIINNLALIAPEANYDALPLDVDVREYLDIDSFDFLNFLIAMEEDLGVTTPESDYGQLVTVNDIVAYMEARLN